MQLYRPGNNDTRNKDNTNNINLINTNIIIITIIMILHDSLQCLDREVTSLRLRAQMT